MMAYLKFLSVTLSVVLSLSAVAADLTDISAEEAREIEARIAEFYGTPADDPLQGRILMSKRTPKYDARKLRPVTLKPHLRLQATVHDPLVQRAQKKSTETYRKLMCRTVYRKHFPELQCEREQVEGKATVEGNDRIEALVRGFIDPEDMAWALSDVPMKGKTRLPLWSDDYWRLQWGATSYRYAEGKEFKNYKTAIADYRQPDEWKEAVTKLSPFKLAKLAADWSPAEKYDLTVGDEAFSMTDEQKTSPANMVGADGNVEEWMGICHGWAAAAIAVPRPDSQVEVIGAGGVKVAWYPHDIRAMASLAWANGNTRSNFVGGRCDAKKAKTYRNGRLVQQDCFDTNPATFHLALGNLVGKLGHSFIIDKNFDYEVWNQPIQSYAFTYFNPLKPSVKTKNWKRDWKKVAVEYETLKDSRKDRFQKPLTRGKRTGDKYDDSGIDYVVGVIATVTYLEEVDPVAGPDIEPDSIVRETYTYDLELYEEEGALVPRGGEWHNNTHPDFLWVPTPNTVASHPFDKVALDYDGKPSAHVTDTAARASGDGYPLCQILKPLIDGSSGTKTYRCRRGE